jgi:hypothetical protein
MSLDVKCTDPTQCQERGNEQATYKCTKVDHKLPFLHKYLSRYHKFPYPFLRRKLFGSGGIIGPREGILVVALDIYKAAFPDAIPENRCFCIESLDDKLAVMSF